MIDIALNRPGWPSLAALECPSIIGQVLSVVNIGKPKQR